MNPQTEVDRVDVEDGGCFPHEKGGDTLGVVLSTFGLL